jgi:hypothetical protein
MADRNGYIGRAPSDSSVIIAKQTFEPTGVQTNFTFSSGYTVGYLDVYINGARQINASDYTASDGSTVGLTTYATSGDVLELVAYKAFNVSNPISNTAGGSLVVGTSLEVGTDLTVTGTSNVGVVTGGTYYGDGSNLTGISTAAVPGINTERHSVFNTINASGIVTASSFSGDGSSLSGVSVPGVSTTGHSIFNTIKASGITTISATTSSTSTTTGALIVSGGVGIAKSLFVGEGISVGGTITYDDVTNIDSVGIVTAGKGFRATTGGIIVTAGVSTFTDDVKIITDNKALYIGAGNDLKIYHDGSHTMMENSTGSLQLGASSINLLNAARSEYTGKFIADGAVELYYDNAKKFETTGAGVIVTGVCTATKFEGPGNVPAGQTGTVTLAASDAGKHVAATGTVTLGTGIFAVGDAVTIYNNSAGDITITLSAVTCYNAADASTGNRTLGARGLATILCTAANTYVISGAGLT